MSDFSHTSPVYGDTASSSSTVTAFFEGRTDADAAVERLADAGISRAAIHLVKDGDLSTDAAIPEEKGFWASLGDFFFPDDDREMYAEGLRRGGYLVTVTGVDAASYNTAVDILDDEGTVDLDERAETWRSEGWTGAATVNEVIPVSRDDFASKTAAPLTGERPVPRATPRADDRDEVIPVVEEQLRVGKRDVNQGSVRVRSYVVETPVNEQVSLRDEDVTIERRAVDRPLDGTDAAFVDRTIEAEEHHEEAVVSKDARVVEEIALRKTSETRDETISDTVRRTEVEVDDTRSGTVSKP